MREKHVHGVPQGSPLLRLLVLVVFDQLIQAEQAAEPAAGVGILKVDGDLVNDLGPAAREIMLDDLADTHRQLDPDDVRGAHHGLHYVVPVQENTLSKNIYLTLDLA